MLPERVKSKMIKCRNTLFKKSLIVLLAMLAVVIKNVLSKVFFFWSEKEVIRKVLKFYYS